jgi:hypothetical protein
MPKETKEITIELVTAVKKNKKGADFVSVKIGKDSWLYCDFKPLFPLLQKGKTYNVVIETIGDFKKLSDILHDDAGIMPDFGHQPAKSYPDTIKAKPTLEQRVALLEKVLRDTGFLS